MYMACKLLACVSILLGYPMQVEEQTLVLKGGERVRVALQLRPLQPGLLTLTGVEWILNEHAPGRKLFTPRRPKHKRSASK